MTKLSLYTVCKKTFLDFTIGVEYYQMKPFIPPIAGLVRCF